MTSDIHGLARGLDDLGVQGGGELKIYAFMIGNKLEDFNRLFEKRNQGDGTIAS
ncbi:MAG: hypothetical protein M0Z50_19225 [Planctomycetia bacterium]|nr:hypothetical protein [Planctomycetia bacterium]